MSVAPSTWESVAGESLEPFLETKPVKCTMDALTGLEIMGKPLKRHWGDLELVVC